MDLIIMAAGLGSRFGGLKQLEPIYNNHCIIDYSIFDAKLAGFDHFIFIIKQEFYDEFKLKIGNRLEKYVNIDYVFQSNDNIPHTFNIPNSRLKPFGTGHAILCAKDYIKSDFAVINADDFYGRSSFFTAANFLKNNKNTNSYALIGYEAIKTITSQNPVKRGICIYKNSKLFDIIESSIKIENQNLIATPLQSTQSNFIVSNNQLVSMNFFVFKKSFLDFLEFYFIRFLNENKNDLSSCEFFLPTIVSNLIQENKNISVNILKSDSSWFGITYKSDLSFVQSFIQDFIEKKIYPQNLWR